MEQNPSLQPNSRSAGLEIPHLLWNPKVHYRVHKSQPAEHILRKLNHAHTFTHCHPPLVLPFRLSDSPPPPRVKQTAYWEVVPSNRKWPDICFLSDPGSWPLQPAPRKPAPGSSHRACKRHTACHGIRTADGWILSTPPNYVFSILLRELINW
jgi:hypothetical protein